MDRWCFFPQAKQLLYFPRFPTAKAFRLGKKKWQFTLYTWNMEAGFLKVVGNWSHCDSIGNWWELQLTGWTSLWYTRTLCVRVHVWIFNWFPGQSKIESFIVSPFMIALLLTNPTSPHCFVFCHLFSLPRFSKISLLANSRSAQVSPKPWGPSQGESSKPQNWQRFAQVILMAGLQAWRAGADLVLSMVQPQPFLGRGLLVEMDLSYLKLFNLPNSRSAKSDMDFVLESSVSTTFPWGSSTVGPRRS